MCIANINSMVYGILMMLIRGVLFIISTINEIIFIFNNSLYSLIFGFSYSSHYEYILIECNYSQPEILSLKKKLTSIVSFELFAKKKSEIFSEFITYNYHSGRPWK